MKKLLISCCIILLFLSSRAQTLDKDTIMLQESTIYGDLRAVESTPFSFNNLTKKTLSILPGSEVAYALATTPSITFYSDNGSNLGYVYYRLRGIDQTRLNVTLNGVPLNEPEDQGSYFNNFPNFLSYIDNVQIIRGAGLSKVGTSTFGGSLNFISKTSIDKPLLETSLSYGSYGTSVRNIALNTNKFFIGFNKTNTDGYKYHSGNRSWSTNYGADLIILKQKAKLFGIIGKQENGMAWVGETLDQISIDPRSNTNLFGEKDNFLNMHNQLSFENTSINNSKITYTLFHQYQNGWYDTDISLFDPSLSASDLISRIKLQFNWIGGIYNQSFNFNKLKLNIGASYNIQYRKHSGLDNYLQAGFIEAYNNKGVKQEVTQYAKAEYKLGGLIFYGDTQIRYISHKYLSRDVSINLYNNLFLNYSCGLSYKHNGHIIHYGIGNSSREPRRSDLLGGLDNYGGSVNRLINEEVFSQDFGYKYSNSDLELSFNLYSMNFKNEFMPTGLYGENSIALYENVKESYRRGIEFSGNYKINKFNFNLATTISKNRFDVIKTSILSPAIIGNLGVTYNITKSIYVGSNTRYNSKTFIDLSNTYTLKGYTVLDTYIGVTKKLFELKLNINNLTNSLIFTNGMIGFDGNPRFFVMNGISSLFTLKINI